jgi:hypothetical protein
VVGLKNQQLIEKNSEGSDIGVIEVISGVRLELMGKTTTIFVGFAGV